jgi:hypothetical protein
VIRKIKSEASDEDMIKNLHFMVELGRKINKAPAAQAQVRAVPCSARLAVPISGVGKEVRGWRIDGPRSSYDSVSIA